MPECLGIEGQPELDKLLRPLQEARLCGVLNGGGYLPGTVQTASKIY